MYVTVVTAVCIIVRGGGSMRRAGGWFHVKKLSHLRCKCPMISSCIGKCRCESFLPSFSSSIDWLTDWVKTRLLRLSRECVKWEKQFKTISYTTRHWLFWISQLLKLFTTIVGGHNWMPAPPCRARQGADRWTDQTRKRCTAFNTIILLLVCPLRCRVREDFRRLLGSRTTYGAGWCVKMWRNFCSTMCRKKNGFIFQGVGVGAKNRAPKSHTPPRGVLICAGNKARPGMGV